MTYQPANALRAPLTTVLGYASALDDGTLGPLAPPQRNAVKKLLDGVVRAQLVLADVLAAGDLAAGRLAPRPEPFDYDDVVRQTLEVFEPLAEAKGVTFVRGSQGLDMPALDLALVSHVLTALVYNAVKRSPRDGVVEVRVVERNGAVLTEVQDVGPALAAEPMIALLAGVGQLDVGGTRELLGLSVSGALLEAQGGTFGAKDGGPGPETVFFFSLPLR